MQCTDKKTIWPHRKIDFEGIETAISVPCGKCLPCLSNKRQDWTFRLQNEYKASKTAHFVTLTYSPKALKKADYQLQKKDVQLYLKRLRKNAKTANIRYYAVGEYGTKTGRPHYHLLLFNTNEEVIRSAWSNLGLVHVGNVTLASVAYCTKYVVQPQDATIRKNKPFSLMSRAYGIGLAYLSDAMLAWHRSGDKNYSLVDNKKIRLPRYYRSKIWHREQDKTRISEASKSKALEIAEKQLHFYEKKFGSRANKVMTEERNAVISRISKKVAFTQTL